MGDSCEVHMYDDIIYRYGSVESHYSQLTAILRSINSVDSKGKDFGITVTPRDYVDKGGCMTIPVV